ncbi:MAG: single-stranded-DNA-specific exonuclease RecJ [Parachlamydiales bacterium]
MGLKARHAAPLWVYPRINPSWTEEIVREFHIHPVSAQVLVSRGFISQDMIQEYLYSKLPDLLDPFLLSDMDKGVERICTAVDNGEKIVVYGDNDVDGMTGTALLTEFLQSIGANIAFHIPNRNELGQSMMSDAYKCAKDHQARLLITVDCGITATKEIERIASEGIDVIVTDHHEPTKKIPLCVATLNPKVYHNLYPNRDLTGVGVAFKLAHALTTHLVRTGRALKHQIDLRSYLDLVAMGTIADMGALLKENRILVRYGLAELKTTGRIGLRKLAKVCDIKLDEITAVDVASKIAPRLNSLGRIAEPRKGVELLLIRDEARAEELAQELDLNNIQRQKIEQVMAEDVEATLEAHPEILQEKALVLASEKWHPGVVAILTTRLAKSYNRPTLLIAVDKGIGKGSMRTIPEFPLLPFLREQADLLLNFGGHDYAAGLTIAEDKIPLLKEKLLARANMTLKEQDVISKLMIDAQVDFTELTFDLMESLALCEPHGNENPPPILFCDARQVRPPRLVGGAHLKFYLEQKGRQLEGIGFGMGELKSQLMRPNLNLRVAFTPQINRFQNKTSIQLLIRDFKVL